MDLSTVEVVSAPASREQLWPLRRGDALLAGGTWLFSEPQPHVRRLIDITGLAGHSASSTRFVDFADLPGPLTGRGRHDGTPRSVAFNVQAFRVAVDTDTGQVRNLQSVHAADAGVVVNPQQCRGQVEGGVAQAIGSALYEEMHVGPDGTVLPQTLRNYHIPQLADVPVTEVYFADTYDDLGPLGAKSMSESPYNPVAPALANAIARACGARMHQLPMTPARIWRELRKGREYGM